MSKAKELRTGFTTGACAAAATKASLAMLLTGRSVGEVHIVLPGGDTTSFALNILGLTETSAATCVRKDGGDDPDVTSGLSVCSEVTLAPWLPDGGIGYLQGEGVGRVTLAGLGIPVGEPAINPVPRAMISNIVRTLLDEHQRPGGVNVRISVPGGEAVARKTMNSRLGILGGISIIGTSGIVVPYSEQAYLDSIQAMVRVAAENGGTTVAVTAGARSENIIREIFPSLPAASAVHYGNHIGKTLEMIGGVSAFREVVAGVMLAKATKLARGEHDLSSRTVGLDRQFIAGMARCSGYGDNTVEAIEQATLVRSVADIIPFGPDEPFYSELVRRCHEVCRKVVPGKGLTFVLVSDEYGSLSFDGREQLFYGKRKTGAG